MADVISTGYVPRPLQAEIHRAVRRFSVLAIHRRFGKTVLAVNELVDRALRCQLHNPQMDYIAPYYKQAKIVAWAMLKDATYKIPGMKAYESELKVVIPLGGNNKATIQLFGADNPDALRGRYSDFIVFDEFAMQPMNIWTEVCRPMLSDRKGGAMFIGTPAGKNQFYKIYKHAEESDDWYAATFSAEDTNVIDPEELADMKANMPEAKYKQEMLCDWMAAVEGSYWREQLKYIYDKKQVRTVPYEPRLPVHCAFDLGIDDCTAIWFVQIHMQEIRLIKYIEIQDVGLQVVMKTLRELPYVYGEMYMPWDIEVRDLGTGATRRSVVEDLGFSVIAARKIAVVDGIEAVRQMLPRCWVDENECSRGIDCIEHYRKKVDPRSGLTMQKPEHDEYSHGADALRTLAVCLEDMGGGYAINRSQGKVMRST